MSSKEVKVEVKQDFLPLSVDAYNTSQFHTTLLWALSFATGHHILNLWDEGALSLPGDFSIHHKYILAICILKTFGRKADKPWETLSNFKSL